MHLVFADYMNRVAEVVAEFVPIPWFLEGDPLRLRMLRMWLRLLIAFRPAAILRAADAYVLVERALRYESQTAP